MQFDIGELGKMANQPSIDLKKKKSKNSAKNLFPTQKIILGSIYNCISALAKQELLVQFTIIIKCLIHI